MTNVQLLTGDIKQENTKESNLTNFRCNHNAHVLFP